MKTYVALLRGINVGGNNKVEMSRLKDLFEKMGYKNVVTYINSGNVIFDTPKKDETTLATNIEKGIEKTFGFPVRVVVRTQKNIEKVARTIPEKWKNDAEQKSDVLFLWDAYAHKESLMLIDTTDDIDSLIYVDGAILWHIEKKQYNKSGMNKFVGTELYKNMTARNVNTVRKIATLMQK